jgi:hypothetical protein
MLGQAIKAAQRAGDPVISPGKVVTPVGDFFPTKLSSFAEPAVEEAPQLSAAQRLV